MFIAEHSAVCPAKSLRAERSCKEHEQDQTKCASFVKMAWAALGGPFLNLYASEVLVLSRIKSKTEHAKTKN